MLYYPKQIILDRWSEREILKSLGWEVKVRKTASEEKNDVNIGYTHKCIGIYTQVSFALSLELSL